VLVEGGGVTVSAFLHAEVLDTLYLTTAPLLIGDGVPGLRFSGHDSLSRALRPQVHRYQLGDDVCTEITLSGRASRSV
jgi:3,4-dihydroxy 2-butanone 4-phosphate synthase/GTP cyclohydrolase II